MSTLKKPMKLPPLRVLRVRNPQKEEATNHCMSAMQTVLACWASAGYNAAGCTALEQQLRACMDSPKPTPKPASSVNYHLSRMYHKIRGPTKKK